MNFESQCSNEFTIFLLQICMIIQPTTDSHLFHQEAISNLLPNNKARGHSSVVDLEKSIFHLEKWGSLISLFSWRNTFLVCTCCYFRWIVISMHLPLEKFFFWILRKLYCSLHGVFVTFIVYFLIQWTLFTTKSDTTKWYTCRYKTNFLLFPLIKMMIKTKFWK